MYCPNCGMKLRNSPTNCEECNENISNERKFHLKKLYLKILQYALGIGVLLLLAYLLGGQGSWYSILLFIIVYSIFYYFLMARHLNYSGDTNLCPKCLEEVPQANFCIECGKELSKVVGYYPGSGLGADVEISQEQIIIYTKRRDRSGNYRRYLTKNFDIDQIKNLHISKCKSPLTKKPCIILEYKGVPKNFQISPFTIDDLEDMFSTDIFAGTDFYRDNF